MADKRERRVRFAACGKKVAYSEEMAKFKCRTGLFAPYKCPFCADWHVASTDEGRSHYAALEDMGKHRRFAAERRAQKR